ncbi:MAG: hypothetical protein LBJ80_03605 [Rickettsiales bacterium]|jgi:hypothetical protein|nr:hypothetical protein [Rickettsiales bacterium]
MSAKHTRRKRSKNTEEDNFEEIEEIEEIKEIQEEKPASKRARTSTNRSGIMTPDMASEYAKRLNVIRKWPRPNKKCIESLQKRKDAFYEFCIKTGTTITNESMYRALGTSRWSILNDMNSEDRTEEGKRLREFWEETQEECSIFRSWAIAEGRMNPIAGIFNQKVHDGYSEEVNIKLEYNNMLGGNSLSEKELARNYQRMIEVSAVEGGDEEREVSEIGDGGKKDSFDEK